MSSNTVNIQAVRGMRDLVPAQQEIFRHIEDLLRGLLSAYGYQEVGLPTLEMTRLFTRLVGEMTDIVEKEMYSFQDKNGESLTLRPEGTAGCARLAQDKGLLFNQTQRFWYSGSMFRYDRPQKGRYRQFEQIGAECFGMAGPDIEAEMLLMNWRMWKTLGLETTLRLEINSLGDAEDRGKYQQALSTYLADFKQVLDEDSQRRMATNPLRILDSKHPRTREILEAAPQMTEFLGAAARQHFTQLCELLDAHALPYVVNPQIVRGLDYYNRTVFEWVTDDLGAQGAVCSGGRYDGLVAQLGGRSTPGVGFALGVDRLCLLLEEDFPTSLLADVFIVSLGDAARHQALVIAERLRDLLVKKKVVLHCGTGKIKAQLKKADLSGARLAIILGEEEIASETVAIKALRERQEQIALPAEQLGDYCIQYFDTKEQKKEN